MNETGTIHDAAAVFSVLRGDQVIELLSRLETDDAQRLLATASAIKPSGGDLERAGERLERELNRPIVTPHTPPASANLKPVSPEPKERSGSSKRSKKRSGKQSKKGNRKPSKNGSLDFLTDMPDYDIQRLLSRVSTACWAPVLKTAPESVRQVILSNVAPAIKRILSQEIESFDGNDQVTRICRQKIIAAANTLPASEPATGRRKAG